MRSRTGQDATPGPDREFAIWGGSNTTSGLETWALVEITPTSDYYASSLIRNPGKKRDEYLFP